MLYGRVLRLFLLLPSLQYTDVYLKPTSTVHGVKTFVVVLHGPLLPAHAHAHVHVLRVWVLRHSGKVPQRTSRN